MKVVCSRSYSTLYSACRNAIEGVGRTTSAGTPLRAWRSVVSFALTLSSLTYILIDAFTTEDEDLLLAPVAFASGYLPTNRRSIASFDSAVATKICCLGLI
ncbi:unnamed protein product [Linum trigynum]|uniref:Uncharacterized protein n=1 Tax=Linum trigynum TaxID=586398 RepID=A0AAV2FXT3_9ROSI